MVSLAGRLVPLSLVLLSCSWWRAALAADTQYEVINNAVDKAGGQKFDREVGESKAKSTLASASEFVHQIFGYAENPSYPKKQVDKVTLYVDDVASEEEEVVTEEDGSGEASSSEIHLSQSYVGTYSEGDVQIEVDGVLYREMARVWQWGGEGAAEGKPIRDGMADYVRLSAGFAPSYWAQPGDGDRWDEGDGVTAYFLQYCDSIQPGIVGALNAKMASGWDASYFQDLMGQSVDQLWQNYKKKHGT